MQIDTNRFQKKTEEHGDYYFPLIVSSKELSSYDSGSLLWHWHPEIELTLVTKGQMMYEVNHDTFCLSQGQALFVNSSTLHTDYICEHQNCEYTSVIFEPKLVYGYENSAVYIKYIRPIIQNSSLSAIHFDLSEEWHGDMIHIIRDIIKIESEKYVTYELDIRSRLEQFWKIMFLNNDTLPVHVPLPKNTYNRIRKIITYIEENYTSDITLDDISEAIHICRSECSRMFKKNMTLSLFEFITQYRIEKGAQYLANTDCSVIEIAALVGFNDSNYFSKVFRKKKGCSPTKYRQYHYKLH